MRPMNIQKERVNQIVKETVYKVLNESNNMVYYDVSAKILKETPKAYYIVVKYFTEKGLSEKEAKMWCPKSCCILDNGNVTKVAKFILDKWTQEYFDFLKSKGYRSSEISFNMAELNQITDKKKTEKEEYQTFYNDLFNKLVEEIRPIIINNIKEIGVYSKMLGQYLLDNDLVSPDKCQDLIKLGDIFIQNFGNGDKEWVIDFFSEKPNREVLYNITNDYADILRGYSIKNRIGEYPKNLKYNNRDIVEYDIKDFYSRKGKLYKLFKKYADYADKFSEVAFNALNSIKRMD